MGTPSKPTAAQIKQMKDALAKLKGLHSSMQNLNPNGAGGISNILDISPDVGPLMNGGGSIIANYYKTRAQAVHNAILDSGKGVETVVNLLQNTIKRYEDHENGVGKTADATAGGGNSGSTNTSAYGRG